MRFPEVYLEQVVETQGALFDAFAAQRPDRSTEDFIVAYMKSRTRAEIDAGQAWVATLEADDLLLRFLPGGYVPTPGSAIAGFVPDWIGRFYATAQWMLDETSSRMVERFPLHFLEAAYPGLHDLELDLAVRKAAGIGDSYPVVMVPSACVAEGGAVYDKTGGS